MSTPKTEPYKVRQRELDARARHATAYTINRRGSKAILRNGSGFKREYRLDPITGQVWTREAWIERENRRRARQRRAA